MFLNVKQFWNLATADGINYIKRFMNIVPTNSVITSNITIMYILRLSVQHPSILPSITMS